jgi:hypothetical protein
LTGRPSIPEKPVIESRSRGVLDAPLSRGMTTHDASLEDVVSGGLRLR